METWFKVVVLSVGGSLGVNARFWLGVWMSRWTSPQFPWATFAINVTGSFFIGFLTVALTRWMPHPNVRLLVITGFLGGYTTFSTFENDNLSLWERGEGLLMAANLVGSVAAGFAAVLLGTILARGLTESAERAAAVGSLNVEVIAVGLPHSVGGGHGQPISAMDRGCQAPASKLDPDKGRRTMIPRSASLLRLYSNANETYQGVPLYGAVVGAARRSRLAGASVFPVELGYGAHRRIHDQASEYSSFEIPIVVEVVDAPERVAALARDLEMMIGECLIVITSVQVIRYTHGTERDEASPPRPPTGLSSSSSRVAEEGGMHPMRIEGEGKRVTVYVGSADTWHGRNLAVAIVEQCRAMGMAGATASRGVMGFGKHSVIHRAHFLGLSEDLPEKIEVVDRPEEIERLLPVLDEMLGGGLIVVEDVHVIRYLHEPKAAKGAKS